MTEITKVHLNNLQLIIGTNCNLRCPHCMGGDPQRNEQMPIEVIDKLIENIYGMDELSFIGYEISLYPDKVKDILDRFADSGISIRRLVFVTNGVIYSQQLMDVFNEFRFKHTNNPEMAKLIFSLDNFHFHNGFTKEKLMNNVDKYRAAAPDCKIAFNDLPHLTLYKKALSLDQNYLNYAPMVVIPFRNYIKADFLPECKNSTCSNGACIKNCIKTFVAVTPKGFVYLSDGAAFEAIGDNDYTHAIGNILDMELFEMIKQNNAKNENEVADLVFKNEKGLLWNTSYFLYKYFRFRIRAIEAIRNNDIEEYKKSLKYFDRAKEELKKRLRQVNMDENEDVNQFGLTFCKYVVGNINSEYGVFKLYEDHNDLAYLTRQYTFRLITEYSEFNPSHKKFLFPFIEYDIFMERWDAYEQNDIERFVPAYKKSR